MTAQRPDENESDGYTIVKQGHLRIGCQIYSKHFQNMLNFDFIDVGDGWVTPKIGDKLSGWQVWDFDDLFFKKSPTLRT